MTLLYKSKFRRRIPICSFVRILPAPKPARKRLAGAIRDAIISTFWDLPVSTGMRASTELIPLIFCMAAAKDRPSCAMVTRGKIRSNRRNRQSLKLWDIWERMTGALAPPLPALRKCIPVRCPSAIRLNNWVLSCRLAGIRVLIKCQWVLDYGSDGFRGQAVIFLPRKAVINSHRGINWISPIFLDRLTSQNQLEEGEKVPGW